MATPLIPPPPPDPVLAERIVKIAVNVIANGQKFENYVKDKEGNNPEFAFLKGGLYSEYYQYVKGVEAAKAATSKATMNNQQPKVESDIEKLRAKIVELKKQVAESEYNVDQQRIVLETVDEAHLFEMYLQSEKEKIDKFTADSGVDLSGLDKILMSKTWSQSVVNSGKNWILDHCETDRQREVIMMYLHYRVKTAPLDSPMRLLVLYIADDLAAYCHKKIPLLTSTIGRYVPKFYAYAYESKIDGVKEKCAKLLRYWEKGYPFDDKCIKYVREPEKTINAENVIRTSEINGLKGKILVENRKTLSGYEKQHQNYAAHINAQIAAIENTINNELRKKALSEAAELVPSVPYYNLPAGVIANMIKKEDFTYKPIEIEKIRVPNVGKPSERLQGQLSRFYMPIPETMLDENGWEKGGLDSYYQIKKEAKKQMEEACIAEGKKIEDLFINKYRSPDPNEMRKVIEEEKQNRRNNPFAYSYDDDKPSDRKRARTPDSPPEYGSSLRLSNHNDKSRIQPISFSLGKNN